MAFGEVVRLLAGDPMINDEIWIRLRRLQTNPAHVPLRGSILSAMEAGCSTWDELCGVFEEDRLRQAWSAAGESPHVADDEADRLRRKGFHLLTPLSPDFPSHWLRCADPPLTLTVKGSLASLGAPALSVVGSREPGPESLRWLETELAEFCRSTRAVIVSGGARGIDQKAHAIAIRSGSPTVALLPSGLEQPYPADFERWFPAIIDGGGAIVSEYPAGAPMRKAHFHHRNRLIAAAGRLVLVVEARAKSGTLITAARAAEIGRPLLVVPGHPMDVRFIGNLQLLSEGATPIRQNEDLTLFWQAEQRAEMREDPGIVHST